MAEAIGKIEAAVAAKRDPEFIIIARTDSAESRGLDEAIKRAQAFIKAGADVAFVEIKAGPTILEDLKRIAAAVPAPCLVNVDAGGKMAELTADEIGALGMRLAIYPGMARCAAGFAIQSACAALKRDGNTAAVRDRMLTPQQYNAALGLMEIEAWEGKYLKG